MGKSIKIRDGYEFLKWGDRIRVVKGKIVIGIYDTIRQASQVARRHREKEGR